MEKLLALIAAVLVMFAFSAVGFAQAQNSAAGTQQGQTMPEKSMDRKVMTYMGEVTTVDQTAHTIVVKGKEGEKTFDVSKAMMKGKVEPNHYVTVKYTEADGKMVASSVHVTAPQKVSSHMKNEEHAS
jgi:phage baseplate assembly protein gpV